MSQVSEKIHALLVELGTTRDEVAASLRAFGAGGRRGISNDCPLARYIQAHDIPNARVGLFNAWLGRLTSAENAEEITELTEPCIQFRRDFDRGEIEL